MSNPFLFISLIIFILPDALSADLSNAFDLVVETPSGTLFPGDKAEFICDARNFSGKGVLKWHWHFANRSAFYKEIIVVQQDDFINDTIGLYRQSILTVPYLRGFSYIGCELEGEDHKSVHKLMPITIFFPPPRKRELGRRKPTLQYPQITIELFGPEIRRPFIQDPLENEEKSLRGPPLLVTNASIHLPPEIKSIRLSCIIPSEDIGRYEWDISFKDSKRLDDDLKPSPTPSFVLNKLALIYRKALIAGRLPLPEPCKENGNSSENSSRVVIPELSNDPVKMEVLEVIISPLMKDTSIVIYTCKSNDENSTTFSSNLTITFLETRTHPQSPSPSPELGERDQELLDLIGILMQILQSSSDSSPGGGGGGGSSGPLYGVGFGSSTIMILMALTIYYLKKQLTQLQDQIKDNEERKRLRDRRNKPRDNHNEKDNFLRDKYETDTEV